MELNMNAVVVQTEGLTAVDMDGEKVMMNIDKGKYYALNDVGSHIWELIEKPRAVNSIVNVLLKEYNIDSKTCEDNVLAFLNRLYHEGLVYIS